MITTRVSLSHFDKILLTESAAHQISKWTNYRFWGETSKLVNISRANFTYGFIDLSKAELLFLDKNEVIFS